VYRTVPTGLDFGAEMSSAGAAHDDDVPDLLNQFTKRYRTGASEGEIKRGANFGDKSLVLKKKRECEKEEGDENT
jgi:hypothetical protein